MGLQAVWCSTLSCSGKKACAKVPQSGSPRCHGLRPASAREPGSIGRGAFAGGPCSCHLWLELQMSMALKAEISRRYHLHLGLSRPKVDDMC